VEQLFIFPFNGNGIEALDCVSNKYKVLGFIDDTKEKQGENKFGFSVYGREELCKYPYSKVLAVPGSPTSFLIRRSIILDFMEDESRYISLIHPNASVSPLARIGRNVLIMAGVVVTSNSEIGDHVCILSNTVIHHDSSIGAYTLIGSNVTVAGNTIVESNCYIGSGSRIINNISIGCNSIVGLGSNVINSLPKGSKVVGNPAKQL
jgi:sugar O-acyltransferase (sialic acid O-acetyltransferase NeuD family)